MLAYSDTEAKVTKGGSPLISLQRRNSPAFVSAAFAMAAALSSLPHLLPSRVPQSKLTYPFRLVAPAVLLPAPSAHTHHHRPISSPQTGKVGRHVPPRCLPSGHSHRGEHGVPVAHSVPLVSDIPTSISRLSIPNEWRFHSARQRFCGGKKSATLSTFPGKKTPAEDAIERAIIALGDRVWTSERTQAHLVKDTKRDVPAQPGSDLLTPDWTPPVPTLSDSSPDPVCPTCARPVSSTESSSFTPQQIASFYHPFTAALSTPPPPLPEQMFFPQSVLAAYVSATSDSESAGDSGMSAEKELELLKAQVQDIARVCKAVATGDLTQKIIVPVKGQTMTELKNIINAMVDRLQTFAVEVERVSLEVGTEGKLGGQAVVPNVEGTWKVLTAVVNKLAANLTNQVRSIAKVTKAVARVIYRKPSTWRRVVKLQN